jgi:gephyrin
MLTRGVSGIRGTTLVLSFPGSPRACAENFAVVEPVLDHALKLLRQAPTDHL